MSREALKGIEQSAYAKATALLLATTAFVGCSSGGNENESQLETNSDAVAAMCDVAPLALDEYQEVIGVGPFATNEASQEERVDVEAVREEAATEVTNNTLGSAFYNTLINNDNAAYQVGSIYSKTMEDFNTARGNEEVRDNICENVVRNLLQNSEMTEFSTANLVRFFNQYDDNDELVGLGIDQDASARDTITVLGIPDRNGNILGGMVINQDGTYAGEFVIEKRIGEDIADIQEGADNVVSPVEDGEVEAPVSQDRTDQGTTGTEQTDQGATGDTDTDQGDTGTEEGTGEDDGGGANGTDSGDNGANEGTNGGGGGECGSGCGETPTEPEPGTTTTTGAPTTTTTTVPPTTTTTTTTTEPDKGEETPTPTVVDTVPDWAS